MHTYIERTHGDNWLPISSAPIDGTWIIGLTTNKKVEPCQYISLGDYVDRWGRGNMTLILTHWRPMTKEESSQYAQFMSR